MRIRTVIVIWQISIMGAFGSGPAAGVTHLSCANRNGQTFCTYNEPISDPGWPYYQYKLYESTSGPITDLSTATLVESQLLPNGGYLDGTSQFTQANRIFTTAPMSTTVNL